jgi:hypothetical protein
MHIFFPYYETNTIFQLTFHSHNFAFHIQYFNFLDESYITLAFEKWHQLFHCFLHHPIDKWRCFRITVFQDSIMHTCVWCVYNAKDKMYIYTTAVQSGDLLENNTFNLKTFDNFWHIWKYYVNIQPASSRIYLYVMYCACVPAPGINFRLWHLPMGVFMKEFLSAAGIHFIAVIGRIANNRLFPACIILQQI